jgi:CheY-like chemotaxis protein
MATILVVDDHVINRTFLVTLLGYGNHHVLEAGDGVEALQSMAQQRPDLVISDVLMPHMDGHEFVARMRATPSLAMVPTIFYTAGHHEAEARAIASSCGVTRVLPKPSEPDAILRAVSEMLGLRHVASALPTLTVPPAEGSRFNTIGNQLA